jgi:hypothetical protein
MLCTKPRQAGRLSDPVWSLKSGCAASRGAHHSVEYTVQPGACGQAHQERAEHAIAPQQQHEHHHKPLPRTAVVVGLPAVRPSLDRELDARDCCSSKFLRA